MTIKIVLDDAKRRALFRWTWTERKPGILFLTSTLHDWPVHEVYSEAEADKLDKRIRAAGGDMDLGSLWAALRAQREFLAARNADNAGAEGVG